MPKFFRSLAPQHKVAVITRTFNRPLLLQRAMQGVVGQSFKDFVWVIVNDGGEAGAVDQVAAAARDKGCNVQVQHLTKQGGMENASNVGIRSCASDFITIHDDDDSWHADFLATLVPALEQRPDWLGIVARTEQVTERIEGAAIHEIGREPFMPWLRAFYLIDMLQQNLFPPIALLFRRRVYDRLGGFNARLSVLGDWDFHVRLLRAGEIGLVDQVLTFYHLRHQEGVDGNTITNNMALHAETDAAIRNGWLREDLENRRVSWGALAGLARQHWAMWKLLHKMTDK
jgi:glycosyltransferase involved in cell wall biosynthesis